MASGKLRIAQLATNVERTPPHNYGGTELVASLLTEELVKRGHEVTLFATGDSGTTARLISVTDRPLRTDGRYAHTQWSAFDMRLVLKLESMQNEFDVIHNHMGWAALPFLGRQRCPVLTTNHNPIKPYARDLYLLFRTLPYIAISHSYRRLNYPDQLNYLDVIYNGVSIDNFVSAPAQERQYLLFIGRLDKDKGVADAVDIAQALQLPLKVAGKIDRPHDGYFIKEVKPRLALPGVEYVGEVDFAAKRQLYGKALAVVYPIAFDEPFGLVMVEALASGTPVMALNRGSVSEVLSDGETAIIGKSVGELISRFPEIGRMDRQACLARARMFSLERMVDAYESLYHTLVSTKVGDPCTLVSKP